MEANDATVLLVDDDPQVRDAVARLLRSAGWMTEQFASAREFQARAPFDGVGCLVLDVSMPGMSGPELQEWMREHDIRLPVVYLSGHCDVRTGVQVMKRGALDVLLKPVDADTLLQAVADAVESNRQEHLRRNAHDEVAGRLASLSAREREVLDRVTAGCLNKQIAADLGIAEKTVKVHRGRMMAKMRVRSVAELVHCCDRLGLVPWRPGQS